jgi:hypothetical protein
MRPVLVSLEIQSLTRRSDANGAGYDQTAKVETPDRGSGREEHRLCFHFVSKICLHWYNTIRLHEYAARRGAQKCRW